MTVTHPHTGVIFFFLNILGTGGCSAIFSNVHFYVVPNFCYVPNYAVAGNFEVSTSVPLFKFKIRLTLTENVQTIYKMMHNTSSFHYTWDPSHKDQETWVRSSSNSLKSSSSEHGVRLCQDGKAMTGGRGETATGRLKTRRHRHVAQYPLLRSASVAFLHSGNLSVLLHSLVQTLVAVYVT